MIQSIQELRKKQEQQVKQSFLNHNVNVLENTFGFSENEKMVIQKDLTKGYMKLLSNFK